MKCPDCHASHISITTTRQADKLTVLRIRKCRICSYVWVTREQQVDASIQWVKRIPQIVLDDG